MNLELKLNFPLHVIIITKYISAPDDELYTKVTTISPCYVLHNKSSKTILIKQDEVYDDCIIILAG